MTPQQFEQVEELFENAKRLTADQRDLFLQSSCGGDLEVLTEVKSLLEADESSTSGLSLSAPVLGRGFVIRAALAADAMPAQIDRYHILELIGEGGMGTVYKAEQRHPIRRTVAIKIIKLGCDTKEVIQRFEAERQALAMMDHPNIARVLDAGATDTGRPYFVMELVQGIPITQYCDSSRLTLQERLKLFITVCQAIQHAHQKGIIHRDLKPSNVLVMTSDAGPVPKVIDFGVAKALHERLTENTLFTQFGGFVGTPQYMSPEQTDTQGIDTRSDIYSLGAMLYELLTGTTPLDVKMLREQGQARMMQAIRDTEPPKPSVRLRESGGPGKLVRLITGDLDWIVMKALEKDRSRRYETANGLVRDIERYLSDEPVEASPPSAAYILRKFARKYRTALSIAGVSSCLLVAATVASIWLAVRATRAETRAVINMTDMYTSRGLELRSSSNAMVPLWFAKSATIVENDPQRVQASLIRVNNYLSGSWTPVAAVQHPAGHPADQMFFDPKNSRYLIATTRRGPPDECCYVWDLAKETLIALPSGFEKPSAAAWTPEGRLLLATTEGHVAMISIPDLNILRRWEPGEPIIAMTVSRDGQLLAAASATKLFAWSIAADASEPAIATHAANIASVAFAPGGDRVVTTSDHNRARVFSITFAANGQLSLQQAFEPVKHLSQVNTSVAAPITPQFMDDGRVLVTIEQFGNNPVRSILKWRDSSSGRELVTTDGDDGPWTMNALPDGKHLLVTAGFGVTYDLSGQHGQPTMGSIAVTFNSRRALLAMGDSTGPVTLQSFDAQGEKKLQGPSIRTFPAKVLAFSDDGQLLAVGGWNGLVTIWRLPADAPTQPPGPTLKYDGRGSLLAFSPDGRFVAPVGIMDRQPGVRSIQVYEVKDAQPIGAKLELNAILAAATFSADGQLIAVATGFGADPKQLRIWDWQSGKQVCPMYELPSEPGGIAYAPDGKAVAVHCDDGQVLLINPANGLLIRRCIGVRREGESSQGCGTIRFSRDGRTLFTLGSKTFQAWDCDTGALRYSIVHAGRCLALAESPDGHILATGTGGGGLQFWSAVDGHAISRHINHPGNVLTAMFSPDGRMVVTSCKDGQVRLWDAQTTALIRTLSVGSGLCDAVFTRDGRWILTTSYNTSNRYGTVSRLWDVQTGFPITAFFLSTGGYHQQIDLSADGRWAAIGGSPEYGVLIDLHQLTSTGGRTARDALLWCEIVSGVRVDNSETVNLTVVEWSERWRRYRAAHPEFHPLEN